MIGRCQIFEGLNEEIMAETGGLKALVQRPQEMLVAMGIVTILGVMVMPIPTILIDLLLSFSITFSLIVLMVAVFMISPLEFSVFPGSYLSLLCSQKLPNTSLPGAH